MEKKEAIIRLQDVGAGVRGEIRAELGGGEGGGGSRILLIMFKSRSLVSLTKKR